MEITLRPDWNQLLEIFPTWGRFEYKIPYVSVHKPMNTEQKSGALFKFKSGKSSVLVTTDGLNAGLNLPNLKRVVNWSSPPSVAIYLNRLGRLGRLDSNFVGECITFSVSWSVSHSQYIAVYESQSLYHSQWVIFNESTSVYHSYCFMVSESQSVYHSLWVTVSVPKSVSHIKWVAVSVSESVYYSKYDRQCVTVSES